GYRFGRAVYLITQAELAASNYLPGSAPDSIGFNYHTAPGLTGAAPLIVYMQNTTDTANNKSGTWSTAISGMTVVHNATTTLPNVTGPFDITFAATGIYSFGELPRGLVPAQNIKGVITNRGATNQTNLPVALNLSGVESFNDNQTIPSIPSCGGQGIATFLPFTPTVVGSDTV